MGADRRGGVGARGVAGKGRGAARWEPGPAWPRGAGRGGGARAGRGAARRGGAGRGGLCGDWPGGRGGARAAAGLSSRRPGPIPRAPGSGPRPTGASVSKPLSSLPVGPARRCPACLTAAGPRPSAGVS